MYQFTFIEVCEKVLIIIIIIGGWIHNSKILDFAVMHYPYRVVMI